MNAKRILLISIIFIIGDLYLFATPQIPDQLIYNGETLNVFLSLPNDFYDDYDLKVNLFGEKEGCVTTACGRGYKATWEIENNLLYLTGIYSCCDDNIKADLGQLFKSRCVNGKVKADWITGCFIAGRGKVITRIDYYISLYENDIEFFFEEGSLVSTEIYDNSKSRKSLYSQDQDMLLEFIYSNIHWEKLPEQKETIRILVRYSANEMGEIDKVDVLRGNNEIFIQEAIRVIKLIPDWDVFYQKGKLIRIPWNIMITFSNENRIKYEKKY